MGLVESFRNFWDPPELRGIATPQIRPGSGWDALELNGRHVQVRLLNLKAAGNAANDPASLIDLGRTGHVAWTENELNVYIREAFRVSGLVFRCLTIISDAFAEGVMRVYEEIDGKPEPANEHPLRLLISEPNPEQSEAEFWTTLLLTMGMNGYGIIEKVRSLAGETVQLYPRNPESMRRKVQQGGAVVWEQRVSNTLYRIIPDQDIIVVPYQFDPALKRLGITPIHVLGREIGIDTNLSAYLKLFLDEGGVPPFVLISKDPIADQSEIEQIQTQWRQKYGGGKSWGTIPVLHGGYELHEIAADLDKMAWPDLRGVNELRIAQGMGVPAHLIGAREAISNGGLATTEMQQAMRFFQLYTIQALRNRVDGALTRGLLREIEPDRRVSLGFDISGILALQEDEDRKANRIRADVQASIITLEEGREARGYEPKAANGEMFLRPFSVVEVTVGAAPEPTPPPVDPNAPKAERKYRNTKAMSMRELAVRASIGNRNRKAQKKLTEIGDRALRKFWKAQGERIVGSLKSADDMSIKTFEDIDWDEEERLLKSIMDKFYETAGVTAATDATSVLGVQVDWSLSNPNIQRTMSKLGTRVVGISETTRQDVAAIVADSLNEGVTLDELSSRLTNQFEETYKGRAMTVARTESQVSYNTASVISYQESGVVEECELFDNVDHTDSYDASDGLTCAERNGLIVALADVPKHIEAEHPNGSLAVAAVIKLGE